MSQYTVPTVRIKHPRTRSGTCIINASDFNASIHEMVTDCSARAAYRGPYSDKEIIEAAAAQARAEQDEAERLKAEELPSDVARQTGQPDIPDFAAEAFDFAVDAPK